MLTSIFFILFFTALQSECVSVFAESEVLHCLTINNDDDKGVVSSPAEVSLPCNTGESDNVCIRYKFLNKVVAGCFPKKYQDLTTCEFVSSFGSDVCCCDSSNNCNIKECGSSSINSNKLNTVDQESHRQLGKVCAVDQPNKFKALPCQFPFTYVDTENGISKTFTDCASMDEAMPYNGIDSGYRGSSWCPLKSGLDSNGQYILQSETTREYWGTCNCFDNVKKECEIGVFNKRVGPVKSGKCKFPFRAIDSMRGSAVFHECVPLSIYRPFGADAFNLLNVEGASWCPTEDGVSSEGNYDLSNIDKNLNWGLCNVCTDSTAPPVDTQAPSLSPTPDGVIIIFPPKEAGTGAYEYGGYEYSKPTKKPTTKAPASGTKFPTVAGQTLSPTLRPTTKAPGAGTTSSPTKRPTTKAPISGTTNPTKRPTTKSPTSPTSSPTAAAPNSNPTTRSPTSKSPTTRRPTTKSPYFPTKPTIAPSIVPTVQPSLAPTHIPTTTGGGAGGGGGAITEMDIYIHADMSRSISMANPVCVKQSGKKCWNLQVDFTDNFQAKLAAQLGGYAGKFPTSKGLRIWISTFTCARNKPVTNVLIPLSGVEDDINMAIEQMFLLKPYQGTCPTQGLNMILKSIKENIENTARQNKAVLILTDGNFDKTDADSASVVTRQMLDLGAEIFAIAVGKGVDNKQLKSVTHDTSGSRIVNIDSFMSLAQSSVSMARVAMGLFKPSGSTAPSKSPIKNPTTAPSNHPSSAPTSRSPTTFPTSKLPTPYPTIAEVPTLSPVDGGSPQTPQPTPVAIEETNHPTPKAEQTANPTVPTMIETEAPTVPEKPEETDAPTHQQLETSSPTPKETKILTPTTQKEETEQPTSGSSETKNPTSGEVETKQPTLGGSETESPSSSNGNGDDDANTTNSPSTSPTSQTGGVDSSKNVPVSSNPVPVAIASSVAFAGILFLGFAWRRRGSKANAASSVERQLSTTTVNHSAAALDQPAIEMKPTQSKATPTSSSSRLAAKLSNETALSPKSSPIQKELSPKE